jgi:hypothetical protein
MHLATQDAHLLNLSLLFPFRFSLQLQFKFRSDDFEKKLRINFCPQFLFDLNGLFYFFFFFRFSAIDQFHQYA